MKYNPLFVDKIRKGNLSAYQELYLDLFPCLTSFAFNYVNDKNVADDLVQDVFLKLWENRKELNIHTSIKAFLYRSVKNSCLNHVRKQAFDESKISEIQLLQMEAMGDHYMLQEEVQSKLHKAINSLPEKCKQVMLLTLSEYSVNEIKDQMSITENTIKTHKKRAYSILRQVLKVFL
jgi:RNA polymerase sigma-70 factor (ECF subfamily)